jgi:hypothetical protein
MQNGGKLILKILLIGIFNIKLNIEFTYILELKFY